MSMLVKTNASLQKSRDRQPALAWRWHGRGDTGSFYPKDMETRHLFHTLRMIWNNFMPPHMRVGRVKLYTFSPLYTPKYMEQAVINIGRELFNRTDITPLWQREIDQMRAWFDRVYFDGVLLLDTPRHLALAPPPTPKRPAMTDPYMPRVEAGEAEIASNIATLYNWIREPDWAEHFGSDELAAWLNSRPSHIAMYLQTAFTALANRVTASEAALASLRAEREAPGEWQDISTAPKDGTWFLGADRGLVIPFRWRNRQFAQHRNGWEFQGNGLRSPTHWRPLPTPPRTRISAQKDRADGEMP